jgi:TRAP-type uncharacterized transport system fused permease subunit
MEKLKQNVQKSVIGCILYLNTWMWAVSSNYNINGIQFANWLLGIASVLVIFYLLMSESECTKTKEFNRWIGRTTGLLLLFSNLIYMVNMEISRMHVLAAIIFITVIILTVLYYKKYRIHNDETN